MVAPTQRIVLLVTALTLCGCSGCNDESAASADGAAPTGTGQPGDEGEDLRTAVDIVEALPLCDVDHRGLLLDMGGEVLGGSYGWKLTTPKGIVNSSHQGATWAQIYDKKFSLSFTLPSTTPVFVSMRAIAKDARSATFFIDGKTVGTVKLRRDESHIGFTRATKLPLDAGLHQLQVSFRGRKRSGGDPFAEVDWVRIGIPDELERTYGAPTHADVLTPAAKLAGVPHRGLALRAPGAIRCTLQIPEEARLRTAVGMRGDGSAKVALRVRVDGEEAKVLQWVEVKGGPTARWTDLDLPLTAYASRVVSLELALTEATGAGRLLFGDPALVVPAAEPPKTARAKTVVIVVLGGVERDDVPPWRGTVTPHLPTLSMLAESATVFDQHRAPSSFVSAVVASLITGLTPRAHRLTDAGARLPEQVATLGGWASSASVRAAMFTGVPSTFEVFGFAREWERFEQYPPNGGRLAAAPIDDAAQWIAESPAAADDAHPLLAVIHARGGHPPWELTPPEAAVLPPADYTGFFSPRRAAEILADVRERRGRLSEADAERMRALYFAGLTREDEALGKLVARLEEQGRWDSTLFIVTGDVSSGRASRFADGGELSEVALSIPLYVHFPAGKHGGERIDHPTEIYDVLHTALVALGIKPAQGLLGRDLSGAVAGFEIDHQRPRVAFVEERYAARWGRFVLRGEIDASPSLCDLQVDPVCSFDRKRLYPLVTQGLLRRLVTASRMPNPPVPREPVTIDSETAAQLKVWGAY